MALLERARVALYIPDPPSPHYRNLLRRTIVCVCIILASGGYSRAKEWRGITPLHSTLTDVVRQFGSCTTSTRTSCTYDWRRERVTLVFLSEACGEGKQRLPRRTVVRIERKPKTATHLPDYHKIDFYHYLAFYLDEEGPSRRFENYVNDEEGFAVEAENDVVTQVHYTAKAEEVARCRASYVKPSDLLPAREVKQVVEFFCPSIMVSCPEKTVEPNEPIVFLASLSRGFPYTEPTYKWSVSAGTIVSGQNTFSIRVDTKGIADGTEITASLTVGGIPVECSNLTSCTTKIQPYRIP